MTYDPNSQTALDPDREALFSELLALNLSHGVARELSGSLLAAGPLDACRVVISEMAKAAKKGNVPEALLTSLLRTDGAHKVGLRVKRAAAKSTADDKHRNILASEHRRLLAAAGLLVDALDLDARLRLREIVLSRLCVSTPDGERLYGRRLRDKALTPEPWLSECIRAAMARTAEVYGPDPASWPSPP